MRNDVKFAASLIGAGVVLAALLVGTSVFASTIEEGVEEGTSYLQQFNEDELNYTFHYAWPRCLALAEQMDNQVEEWTPEQNYTLGACIALGNEMARRQQLREI